ncbi:MAG: hypothetical protein AAF548_00035 [Actinomycetota bacterium]
MAESRWVEVYREALLSADPDAVHDLLDRKGTGPFETGPDYVARALRNRAVDIARHEARSTPLHEGTPIPSSERDPSDLIIARERWSTFAAAFVELSEKDRFVLEMAANNVVDDDVRTLWKAKFRESPSSESIRQRRSRARRRLRAHMDSFDRSDGDD